MRSYWWSMGLRGLSVLMFVLLVTACGGGGGGGGGDNPGGTGDTTPPTMSTFGLSVTAVSAAQINLTWTAATDNVGVTGYKIFRWGEEVATSSGTSWQNTGLTANQQYCYTVVAVDAAGNTSTLSQLEICATTQSTAADASAPTVPTGLSATATSSSQIDLTWGASTDNVGVTGYKVYRSGSEITSNASTSYQNTGLAANTPYCYSVAAYDAVGNLSAESSEVCATTQSRVVAAHLLNDTGIVKWGGNGSNSLTAAPAGYPGQDADIGRDAQASAGTLVKVGAGSAGFDFTKLDSNGNVLAASATSWSCVRDNHTGLIWELKTDDGGLRDQGNTYSWYNADFATNGDYAGNQGGGICSGGISCDTFAYVTAVNSIGLCGAGDWRLPTRDELLSIVDNSKAYPSPNIDSNYFPNTTVSSSFWTSSPYVGNYSWSSGAWVVEFIKGAVNYDGKGYDHPVRLVRGGQ